MTGIDVIKGAESFFLPGGSIGILICHGFNATPQSVRYLGEGFSQYGYTVYAPRLTGHGTSIHDMETATYHDWMANVTNAYLLLKQTCRHVFVIGQSMGGALVLDLASKVSCDGVLTINAALSVPEYEKLAHQTEPKFIAEGTPDINDTQATEIIYEQIPLTAIHQLLNLMKITKQQVPLVTSPIMIFVSPEDHVVPAYCSYDIFDSVTSSEKELIPLHHSYHVASLDYDKNQIIKHTVAFIQTHTEHATVAS